MSLGSYEGATDFIGLASINLYLSILCAFNTFRNLEPVEIDISSVDIC